MSPRLRHSAVALQTGQPPLPTVYECTLCGERLVGIRRCPDCQLFCRALGPGGHCPECDTPILLADLLIAEVQP
jgi:hypothetical protein